MDVPEVLILIQEPPPFIRIVCIMCYSHPVILSRHNAFCSICRKRRGWHLFLTCSNQGNVDSLVLMFSSNLAHIQCFISSTAAIKDASQPTSLQPNKRIHPDLESLFSPSPFPNCVWIFISFKFDANDTKQEYPTAPGKSKTDKLL